MAADKKMKEKQSQLETWHQSRVQGHFMRPKLTVCFLSIWEETNIQPKTWRKVPIKVQRNSAHRSFPLSFCLIILTPAQFIERLRNFKGAFEALFENSIFIFLGMDNSTVQKMLELRPTFTFQKLSGTTLRVTERPNSVIWVVQKAHGLKYLEKLSKFENKKRSCR